MMVRVEFIGRMKREIELINNISMDTEKMTIPVSQNLGASSPL